MDLELVRQQISSQAKRGGPANNFIFFSGKRQKLDWDICESISVSDPACKLFYSFSSVKYFPLLYPDKLKNSEFEWEQFWFIAKIKKSLPE